MYTQAARRENCEEHSSEGSLSTEGLWGLEPMHDLFPHESVKNCSPQILWESAFSGKKIQAFNFCPFWTNDNQVGNIIPVDRHPDKFHTDLWQVKL